MIKKTLGGDRLGAGKRMRVEMKGYERSTHDLSYIWRSSMASGTLVPFMSKVALPGDTWDIDLETQIMTHPTVGPLFGSYKVQLDVFCTPIRLYNSWLHNNRLGIGMNMAQVLLPQVNVTASTNQTPVDNQQINASALLKYLGLSGIGCNEPGVTNTSLTIPYNAIPLLTYWDIFKNYYANKQEENAYVIHTGNVLFPADIKINGTTLPQAPASGSHTYALGDTISFDYDHTVTTTGPEANALSAITITTSTGPMNLLTLYPGVINSSSATTLYIVADVPGNVGIDQLSWSAPENLGIQLTPFALTNIDDMRDEILAQAGNATFSIDGSSLTPYSLPLQTVPQPDSTTKYAMQYSQEGLAVKTYNSDLLNNWIQTEVYTTISNIAKVDTSTGSFTMDTLNFTQKIYNLMNRVAASGGTYVDWIETVYDVDFFRQAETPMYMGGLIQELVFQSVISNASANNAQGQNQPLGTLAGRGSLKQNRKGGKIQIKVHEHSYITGIVSLTPRPDYSQGNNWDVDLKTMDDFHKPELDEIGFQDLDTSLMAWFGTTRDNFGAPIIHSAGKQPAWINYMTDYNRSYGSFAEPLNEMFMTLNRRYEINPSTNTIKDVTTYIDPTKYNFIFAYTKLDAQNFWVQIGNNVTVRRKMSAKIIPNL